MKDPGFSSVSLPPPYVSLALRLSCLMTVKWLEWLQKHQVTATLRDRKGLSLPGRPSVQWTKIFLDTPPPVKSPQLGMATRTSYQLQFTFRVGDEEKGWTPKQLQGQILTDSMSFARRSHDALLLVPVSESPSSGGFSCYFCTLPWYTEISFAATRAMSPENPLCGWDPIYVYLSGPRCHRRISVPSWATVCWDTRCCRFSPIVPSLPEGLLRKRGSGLYSQILQSIWTLYYHLLSPTFSFLPELSPNTTEFNQYLNSLSSEISFLLPPSYFEHLCIILLVWRHALIYHDFICTKFFQHLILWN